MSRETDRPLWIGLVVLGVALAINSLLGPLAAAVVEYPFSQSMVNQTIGLDAVSLAVVAPWSLLAAEAVRRKHHAGPILAIPPAAYSAYMFSQYVLGPTYLEYPAVMPLHLGIFVLGWVLVVLAWVRIDVSDLPTVGERRWRIYAGGVGFFAFFTFARYVPSFVGMASGEPISEEFAQDPTMFWTIFLLDVGVVVPATIGASVGAYRGRAWGRKALYPLAGWFALVPISVSAMSIVMYLNDDPYGSLGSVAFLTSAAVAFTAFVVWVHLPLFGGDGSPDTGPASETTG
ncbi:hypothetical protein L593_00635 [Salinarchaeum sp. Harcht-Bsk1]|uniref:hypothetical protein n=1 Tax=Salinarchaeum sp. Harcht-Bsk1 TaxID=1333523 RepID=UPI00034243F8|nr:hypothetical protein [Salinarchaeum sp. Harcht-Bsk1]AGN00082.1 hypothetical protein L593_00635 [Salinarchaeum sp. Harcht-Bsk1]